MATREQQVRRREALAPLRQRGFALYYASRLVNQLGGAMASVALAFAVLEISGNDPSAVGYVLAAHTVPMVVLLLWGGVIADRFPRNVVLQVSNLTSAVLQAGIAVLVLTGTTHLWPIVVLSLLHGMAQGLGFPAMASIVPQLVEREHLQQANTLLSLARGTITVVGPSLAGVLVVTAGAGWALAVDAVTWLVSAVLLGLVTLPPRPQPDRPPASTLDELREGWGYVRRTTWLWVVVVGFAVLNATTAGVWFTLGPALAKQTIGVQGWGLALSAESAGLLLTTLVMLRVRLERPLLLGMLGITTLSLPMLCMGLAPHLLLVVAATFVAGAGTEVFNLGWNLAMQEHVPDEMLSRAYSYDALGSFVAMPVGQVVVGPLALLVGFTPMMIGGAVLYAAVCAAVLASRSVRDLRRLPATTTPVSTTSA